ncbi:hypothetical protein_gp010 [Bacillus phage vB_BceM_WH1]|nr:hypothetical protein_gp010 [Bacillus phage vB_BceM_WH1]
MEENYKEFVKNMFGKKAEVAEEGPATVKFTPKMVLLTPEETLAATKIGYEELEQLHIELDKCLEAVSETGIYQCLQPYIQDLLDAMQDVEEVLNNDIDETKLSDVVKEEYEKLQANRSYLLRFLLENNSKK